MRKLIYIIRHCKASGQEPSAELTEEGWTQAERLANRLAHEGIQRIVSSPFTRAIQSIEPLARRLDVEIETDSRLIERTLSNAALPDWLTCLQATFNDLDVCYAGGESSRAATARAVAAVEDILARESQITALVSHGNLSTLLLKYFDDRFGFEEWKKMSNPDVFCVEIGDAETRVERIWQEDKCM